MTEVARRIPVPASAIFDVLADGWSYTNWVVGASHIRRVEGAWPAPGARIHYSMGLWPFIFGDITTVRSCAPPTMLELRAQLWPFGAATIRLELVALGPTVTEVHMIERVTEGPWRLTPGPAQSLLLSPRNSESLARLARVVTAKVQDG